ncbi:hypothetical protein OE88DRAFT_412400 [Heliocybe sulcata]|uniref:Uncharacterized protein n=1 Tax=Heliocybe sulcata TaxID=5364 RepID=A0A5C3MWF8_9AGAM|nr:hypothetical protein OE88DRAFT_412400 [Heliocybe sulcata]
MYRLWEVGLILAAYDDDSAHNRGRPLYAPYLSASRYLPITWVLSLFLIIGDLLLTPEISIRGPQSSRWESLSLGLQALMQHLPMLTLYLVHVRHHDIRRATDSKAQSYVHRPLSRPWLPFHRYMLSTVTITSLRHIECAGTYL